MGKTPDPPRYVLSVSVSKQWYIIANTTELERAAKIAWRLLHHGIVNNVSLGSAPVVATHDEKIAELIWDSLRAREAGLKTLGTPSFNDEDMAKAIEELQDIINNGPSG